MLCGFCKSKKSADIKQRFKITGQKAPGPNFFAEFNIPTYKEEAEISKTYGKITLATVKKSDPCFAMVSPGAKIATMPPIKSSKNITMVSKAKKSSDWTLYANFSARSLPCFDKILQ